MNEFKVSPSIFYPTYASKARRIIHQGGQWSGKTVNILAVLATHASENKSKMMGLGDEVITITADSIPHLRGGALRDFERYIYPHFESKIKQYNRTDHIFYFHNGAIIEFKSFEDEYTARGAKRTRLFINEANKYDYLTYFQLDSRTDIQTIIDYNPTEKFWSHDKVQALPDTVLFISDHRHNPFLSESKHNEIESITDTELWKVYARGMTGNIIGTIFPDWTCIPDEDYPVEDGVFWGIDYGYSSDPTAIVKCVKIANSIFLDEVSYETGTNPTNIVQLLKVNGYLPGMPIYSEHDPESISQLRRLGINVLPARKGPGSIKAGIQKIKEYKIFYTYSSNNLKEELKRYVWEQDKNTGQSTNVPKAGYDHILDSVRYACFTHFFRVKD